MALGIGEYIKNRRTVRSDVNPLDKSTIVSIYPKEVIERNVTLEPGYFQIGAGSVATPAVLVVGTSSWWRDIDPEQPLLEIVVGSVNVARSVVEDYCSALIGYKAGIAQPGLFFVPGAHTSEDVKKNFSAKLAIAEQMQRAWYSALVEMADVLWARSNGNPLVISDDMKNAAQQLNLNTKDWLKNYQAIELVRCKACGTLLQPGFPVCFNCKHVNDEAKAKAMGYKVG